MKPKRWLLLEVLFAFYLISAPVYANGSDPPASEPSAPAKDLSSLDLEALLNVKVTTASKFSQKLSDAPGVMTVVTKDELRRFGGLTLREILERVAGLAGSTASFTDRSIIAARGDQTTINGGHILFLINGRPTREVLEGGLAGDLLETFPVNILERIEVVKGPGSVLYGTNAFSAVINLITLKAEGNKLVVRASGADGPGAATSEELTFKRGDLSIVSAGEFHQQPNWATPVQTMYFGLEHATIPDRGKGAYLGINYKGLSFMSSFTDWDTSYIEGAVGEAQWRRGFADLGYSLKARDNWDMSFDLTYTRFTLNAQNSIPFITRNSNDVVLEWTNVVSLTARDQLTFGALYNYIQGQENFFGTNPSSVISQGSRPGEAFYAQLDHTLLDKVKLIGGMQANKIENIKLNVVPRVGLIWNPASHHTIKVLYSEAFRAPSLNETLLHYIPPPAIGGPSLLGNPNLLPEQVATVDLAWGYQGNRFESEVGYFHSKLTNNIILANVTTAGTYVNMGQATFRGVEMEGKYYFKKDFFLTGSAIYQANEDGNGNKNITPIANFGAKAGVSYLSPNGLTVGLFDVHQGPVPGYSNSTNPRPGAYDLLNANLRYDLSKLLHASGQTGVALLLHADNLTNKAVWLPDWKDAPGDSIFYNRGRTVYFGIEVSFKPE